MVHRKDVSEFSSQIHSFKHKLIDIFIKNTNVTNIYGTTLSSRQALKCTSNPLAADRVQFYLKNQLST